MVKTITLWSGSKYILLNMGIAKRFGLGIYIDGWSFGIDFGPLWISIEW